MKISTRAQYGLRVLVHLAAHYGKGVVLLKDIARREELPERYLENLMTPLRAAGVVKTSRGARGGFALAKRPWEVRLSQVVELLEGPIAPVRCVDDPRECSRSVVCVTRDVWTRVKEAIFHVLDSLTLQDLARMQQEKTRTGPSMYQI